MQTRQTLANDIVTHMRALFFKLGRTEEEIQKLTSIMRQNTLNKSLDFAWRLVDTLEPLHPNHSQDMMLARTELHFIQDSAGLLEQRHLWNINSALEHKVSKLERALLRTEGEKQRLTEKLEDSSEENAGLRLALRRQQQLANTLRKQLHEIKPDTKERNPYSPYTSPAFAHNK